MSNPEAVEAEPFCARICSKSSEIDEAITADIAELATCWIP
jgi:hypothetical protein